MERSPCWSCSSQLLANLPLDLPLRSLPSIGTSPTFKQVEERIWFCTAVIVMIVRLAIVIMMIAVSSVEHVESYSRRVACTVGPTTLASTPPTTAAASSSWCLSQHKLLVLLIFLHCRSSLWFSLSISFTRRQLGGLPDVAAAAPVYLETSS